MRTPSKDSNSIYKLNIKTVYISLVAILFVIISCNQHSPKKTKIENNTPVQVINKAYIPTSTPIYICSFQNNQTLELEGGSRTSNTPVTWRKMNGGNTQLWLIQEKDHAYVIRSYYSTKVLAVNLDNSTIVQQDFDEKNNQLWHLSGTKDSLRLLNEATKKFLSIEKGKLSTEFDNKSNGQLWKLKSFQNIKNEGVYCNCEDNFKSIKARVESSYSGFKDKVTPQMQAKYDSLCSKLLSRAKQTENSITCYKILKNYLSFFKDGHLNVKSLSRLKEMQSLIVPQLEGAASFQLSNINDSVILISLPSFELGNKNTIDKLIKSNQSKLLKTPYLILDVRNNGGGNDVTWKILIPYLYTNPIKNAGIDFRASDETIKEYDALYGSEDDYKRQRKQILIEREKAIGKFVTQLKDWTQKCDSVTKNPKKIVILINEKCASSAEEFLLAAKQSKKVKLMGQPTSGTLDYSNVIEVTCPSPEFKLCYPTTRSKRLPQYSVDRDKIKPDVYIPYNKDWIQEAENELKNKKNQNIK